MPATVNSDIRHSIRQLCRSWSFTAPAVLGLALAIGATASVFSVVYAMLLKPMGINDTERLVTLWQTEPGRGQLHVEVSLNDLRQWEKQKNLLENVALASSVNLDVPVFEGGEPQQVDLATVTGSFFPLLGARPALGRLISPDDDRPGAPNVLVISHRLWQSRFGSDPALIGRKIRTGGDTATVIGVTSPDFDFPRDVDIFAPLHAAWPTVDQQPDFRVFRAVGKLKPGVHPKAAEAALTVLAAQRTKHAGVLVTPLLDEIFGPARLAVWILLGAVAVVLLIACANVANLLLARATVRSRELALRSVLGASRTRVVSLLLTESVLIAAMAASIGIGFAFFGTRILARLAPPEVPRLDEIALNGPVLAFGIVVSLLTVVLFGLGPALAAARRDPAEALRQGGGRSQSAGRASVAIRQWLTAAQVAFSVTLLVGAGLLIRSFQSLSAVDPGFRADRVLTFRITTETGSQEKRRSLYNGVLERVRALPGVESAAAVLLRPLSGLVGWDNVYELETQTPDDAARNPNANYEAVSPQYFATMQIRMLAGRDFTDADTEQAPGVVIINESTARRHFGSPHLAIGKRLRLSKNPKAPWLTVTGVVADVRYREWETARPDMYVPISQRAQHRSDFVIRTSGDPGQLAAAVRREVFAIDPNQPISQVTTMDRLVDRALARSRFTGFVLTALAFCALALSSLGIYSVLAWNVARRTPEIGVRMAIGATPAAILRMVAANTFRFVGVGLAAGLVGAVALTRAVQSLLYGVTPWNAGAWLGAALVMGLVAALACAGPALRAARVDPARALSTE